MHISEDLIWTKRHTVDQQDSTEAVLSEETEEAWDVT